MKQRTEVLSKIRENLLSRKTEMAIELSRSSHDKVSDGQVQDSGDEL